MNYLSEIVQCMYIHINVVVGEGERRGRRDKSGIFLFGVCGFRPILKGASTKTSTVNQKEQKWQPKKQKTQKDWKIGQVSYLGEHQTDQECLHMLLYQVHFPSFHPQNKYQGKYQDQGLRVAKNCRNREHLQCLFYVV